ncbi:MAG: hypothetical protein ACR2LM_08145 [Pyrinomonadaceae bacterium]
MPIPSVGYAFICEGIRREINNKLNVLGFFGVLPDVNVAVGELGKNVVLMFVVGLRGPSDEVTMKAEVVNPDGTPLISSDEIAFPGITGTDGGVAGFAFAPIIFSHVGLHYLRVFINGKQAYKEPFLVRVGVIPNP